MSKSKKHRSGRRANNHKNQNLNTPVQPSNEPSPQMSSSLESVSADPPINSEPDDSLRTNDRSGSPSPLRLKPGRLLLTAAGAVVCLLTIQYFNSRMSGSFPSGDISTNLSKTGSTANIVTEETPAAQDTSSDSETTSETQKPAAETHKNDPEGNGTPAAAENSRPDPAASEDSRPDPAANEDRHTDADRHTNEDPERSGNEEEYDRGEEYEEEYNEEDDGYEYYGNDGDGEDYEDYEDGGDNEDYEEYEDDDEYEEYDEDDEDGHIHGLD